MKSFDEGKFIANTLKQQWDSVYCFANDPNTMIWEIWKKLFLEVLDKHASLQHKKLRTKNHPWIRGNIKTC